MKVKDHVAVDSVTAMDREASLERFGVTEREGRLRLPERAQDLRMQAVCIPGLGIDAIANALPVIFSRRRNSVTIIAQPHLLSALELPKRLLDSSELGVLRDSIMETGSDILGWGLYPWLNLTGISARTKAL